MRRSRLAAWSFDISRVLGLFLALGCPAIGQGPAPPVRMTIELASSPRAGTIGPDVAPEFTLGLSQGQLLEIVPVDPGLAEAVPGSTPGLWSLRAQHTGPVRWRARIEAPATASLLVSEADRNESVPLVGLLDATHHATLDERHDVEIRRLPWDAIELQLEEGTGVVEPGAAVPIRVGVNILTPEPTRVSLRLSALLRPAAGGEPVWREERQDVVDTNASPSPARLVVVTTPRVEGTYVFEVRAEWHPIDSDEGPRLTRWWRRRRSTDAVESAERAATITVASDRPSPAALPRPAGVEQVVDGVDLSRPRRARSLLAGQSPLEPGASRWTPPHELTVEPQRRERFWSLIGRVAPGAAEPLRASDPGQVSWLAASLRVAHPNRPHRLSATVLHGNPEDLSIGLVAPGDSPRVILSARGYGSAPTDPAATTTGPARPTVLSWLVWPDTTEMVAIVANLSSDRAPWLGGLSLAELTDQPPALVPLGAPSESRKLAVSLARAADLERFGGRLATGAFDSWSHVQNLAAYLEHCGATSVVLPPLPAERPNRLTLGGQVEADCLGADRNDLIIAQLARRGIAVHIAADCSGPLPGLPAPDSAEAIRRGLVRLDAAGRVEAQPTYQILNPDVQVALRDHLMKLVDRGEGRPRPAGLVVRLGQGPTLPGRPDSGLDDMTYARFVDAMLRGSQAPGLSADDPARFQARTRFVAGPGTVPWLDWRCREIGRFYSDLARSVTERVPGASLAVVTPTLDDGPLGAEARRCDAAGLPATQAWRVVGLDLASWPQEAPGLFVMRGVGLEPGLSRDLSMRGELDVEVLSRPRRGAVVGLASSLPSNAPAAIELVGPPLAPGDPGEEALGHVIASLDVHWTVVDSSTIAGQEERIRRFARVLRSLPGPPQTPAEPAPPSGIAVRTRTSDGWTYLAMANDTPYPVVIQADLAAGPDVALEDLGRGLRLRHEPADGGGKRVVVEIAPFGVAALRAGAPEISLNKVTPFFRGRPEVDRELVSAQLRRLSYEAPVGPANPGFEPDPANPNAEIARTGALDPAGWSAEGEGRASVSIDLARSRTGQGSLRLDASTAPASTVSDPFAPSAGTLDIRVWLRTEPADLPVRVRLEPSNSANRSPAASASLPRRDRTEWTAEAVRMPELPGAASAVRLRFEALAPGRLWLDDLQVSGPELLQARGALSASLRAYAEGRFADFARLAGSYSVRKLGPMQAAETATAPGPDATDLPSGRRLR